MQLATGLLFVTRILLHPTDIDLEMRPCFISRCFSLYPSIAIIFSAEIAWLCAVIARRG